jgi:hypothetical protein
MANQIDYMTISTLYTRNPDGTYTPKAGSVLAMCSDPAATNPTGQCQRPVDGVVIPVYSGSQTCDAMVAAAFAATKTAAGIP